jgi:membrane-anchored glycerophosphoryl diester phosphodiesterase (GDPDase)
VRPDITVPSVFLVLPLGVILAVAGLALSAFYLQWLGRRVIAETESGLSGPRSALNLWGNLLLLTLLLLVVLSVMGMAVLFLASFIGLFWMPMAWFMMLVASSFGLFIAVHLLFTIPGIVQLRRGLFQAIRESLLLTRSDFFNVSFLLLLIFVISRGFNFVWTLPAFDSWSAVIGLAGHAFVSTALTATLFIFYQERLNYLEILQQIRAAKAQSIVLK